MRQATERLDARTGRRRGARPWGRLGVALLLVPLAATACQEDSSVISPHNPDPLVVIATADFGEAELAGSILSTALVREGYRVRLESRSGTQEQVMQKVERGDATLTVGFTGELLQRYDPASTVTSSGDVYAAMTAALPEGLTAADASPTEDAPTLVVSRNTSDTQNLQTMSDLRGKCGEFAVGARPEMLADTSVTDALASGYDCTFGRQVPLDTNPRSVEEALRSGRIGVGMMQSSDPVLSSDDMVSLDDDEDAIRAQNLVPVYRKGELSEDELTLVNRISGELDTDSMRELLRGIEFGSASSADLANYWLDKHSD